MQSTIVQTLAAAAVLSALVTASAIPAHGGAFPHSAHRRHHAKLSELSKRNLSPRALLSNTGFGTLYYDVNGGGTCGPANGWSSFPETQGYTMCEPWTGPKTIAQRGTNKIVALPVSMMTGNLEKYCGKEVTATYNGKTISGLIAWDGCAACDSGNGIDFSSSVFGELVGTENCGAGKVQGVSWQIKENSLWDTDGNPVSGGSDSDDIAPSSTIVSEDVVEPSSSSSSSSSTQARVSSTQERVSSTQEQGTPVATEETKQRTRISLSEEQDSIGDNGSKKIANMRLPLLAVAMPTSSSSEEAQPEATKAAVVAFVSSSTTSGTACNDQAGQWKCAGNALQQCTQDGNNWVWNERFECSVAPINCETANPVCPGKAVSIKKMRL